MDDKYAKEYKKQHSQSQFHAKLEDRWLPKESEKWHYEKVTKLKKPKPDPATVEAALRLEEQLWAS